MLASETTISHSMLASETTISHSMLASETTISHSMLASETFSCCLRHSVVTETISVALLHYLV